MTTGHVFIAVSLDGYIARPDGAIDWLVEGWPEVGHDYGYTEFIGGVDGRGVRRSRRCRRSRSGCMRSRS
jgi:hypothetical protein